MVFGTIAAVCMLDETTATPKHTAEHRVRLTDDDLTVIMAALKGRLAMTRGERRERMLRLIARLEAVAPGNPHWRLSGAAGYVSE